MVKEALATTPHGGAACVPAKGPTQGEAQAPSQIEDGGAMGDERRGCGRERRRSLEQTRQQLIDLNRSNSGREFGIGFIMSQRTSFFDEEVRWNWNVRSYRARINYLFIVSLDVCGASDGIGTSGVR
jgi:hypothetical protein